MPSPVYSKTRELVPATAVTVDGALPAFPSGPTSGVVKFAGAMRNTKIGSARATLSNLTVFSAVDIKLQTSADGAVWSDVGNGAFTQLTADGTTRLDITDDTAFERFVRAYIDLTGTPGTATVKVELYYMQCGPRDELSPPGLKDRFD
jgi:hypothetical protein